MERRDFEVFITSLVESMVIKCKEVNVTFVFMTIMTMCACEWIRWAGFVYCETGN